MTDDSVSSLEGSEEKFSLAASTEEGYVKTAAYNYISRKSFIHGPQNVEMRGKSIIKDGVHIRGDFSTVKIGRYCTIHENTIIRPPSYQASFDANAEEQIKFLPLLIGNHTRIGKNCVIEAASIGASVYIGDDVVISKRVIVKDCCYIESGAVIVDDTVIPPFSRVKGCPAKIVEEGLMPESVVVTFPEDCVKGFTEFVRSLKKENKSKD